LIDSSRQVVDPFDVQSMHIPLLSIFLLKAWFYKNTLQTNFCSLCYFQRIMAFLEHLQSTITKIEFIFYIIIFLDSSFASFSLHFTFNVVLKRKNFTKCHFMQKFKQTISYLGVSIIDPIQWINPIRSDMT
jgi:hypothetical protein